jgi:hypothetical protein
MGPKTNGSPVKTSPPVEERKTRDDAFHREVRALPPVAEGHAVINVDLKFDWKDRLKVLFGRTARVSVVQPIRALTAADDKLFLALGIPSCRLVVDGTITPGLPPPSQPG